MIGIQNVEQIYEIYGAQRARSIMSGFLTSVNFRVSDNSSKQYIKELFGKNRKVEAYAPGPEPGHGGGEPGGLCGGGLEYFTAPDRPGHHRAAGQPAPSCSSLTAIRPSEGFEHGRDISPLTWRPQRQQQQHQRHWHRRGGGGHGGGQFFPPWWTRRSALTTST